MTHNHFTILRNLLYLGGTNCNKISRKVIIEGFPPEFREGAENDLVELISKYRFVIPDMKFHTIGINPERIDDVIRMINPDGEEFMVRTSRNLDYSK